MPLLVSENDLNLPMQLDFSSFLFVQAKVRILILQKKFKNRPLKSDWAAYRVRAHGGRHQKLCKADRLRGSSPTAKYSSQPSRPSCLSHFYRSGYNVYACKELFLKS